MAAGFPPRDFWTLTPRLYALQMHGARARIRVEMTMRNRQAWNTAALVGAAMAGKMPRYDDFFPTYRAEAKAAQNADQQEAALRVLAALWGARPAESDGDN